MASGVLPAVLACSFSFISAMTYSDMQHVPGGRRTPGGGGFISKLLLILL